MFICFQNFKFSSACLSHIFATGLLFLGAPIFFSQPAKAIDIEVGDEFEWAYPAGPILELGVGVEGTWGGVNGSAGNVIIEVQYPGYKPFDDGSFIPPEDNKTTSYEAYVYVGKLKAMIGLGDIEGDEFALNEWNVKLNVFGSYSKAKLEEETVINDSAVGVIEFSGNSALDEKFVMVIRAAGANVRKILGPPDAKAAFFIGSAMKALGYKRKMYNDPNRKDFEGTEITTLGFELGGIFNFSDDVSLELALECNGSIALGGINKTIYQSDDEAFASIKLHFLKNGELYFESGYRLSIDTGNDLREGYTFARGGFRYMFDYNP